MSDLRRATAIVGAYEHPTRFAPDKSEFLLHLESARGALEDAGLTRQDVDAYMTSGSGPSSGMLLADYLNLHPRFLDDTDVGGASFLFHLNRAWIGIQAGWFRCALITYGSAARSRGIAVGTGGLTRRSTHQLAPTPDSFEEVYGLTTVGMRAMMATRHMHEYGTTPEQLAMVAVVMREHASRNPQAARREPITVADVLNSRVISTPLHALDCCLITDGGGAIVVTSRDVARGCRSRPVWVLGLGESVIHHEGGHRDWTATGGRESAPRAFGMAGVRHDDIDMAMLYDAFTITVITSLEDVGFCPVGEGGRFVEGGSIRLGGRLPVNTDGGGLSSNHPGRRGVFLLIEATRQLRHEAGGRQVPDCRIAVAHATGGATGLRQSAATAVLARD
jgi:acetyl-CoA C-acetyltransferase